MLIFQKNDLEKLLPHRETALCIEKAGFFGGREVRCIYQVTATDDPKMVGHFPEKPINPGHWLTEGMAISSLLLLKLTGKSNGELPVLRECNAKFLAMIFPPARIFIAPKLKKMRGDFFVFHVIATQGGIKVAEAEIKGAVLRT